MYYANNTLSVVTTKTQLNTLCSVLLVTYQVIYVHYNQYIYWVCYV